MGGGGVIGARGLVVEVGAEGCQFMGRAGF